ncbi:MAG TPA: serine hydrolase [Candidatus Saccharimonadales bacterium]|nr:serine hydrolase [Candidatus Saccharimonadales bacterium]
MQHGWMALGHVDPSLFRHWLKHTKWLRLLGWAFLGIAFLTIPMQLLYPSDRALPLYSVGGLMIGGKNKDQLIATFDDYANNGEVTIVTPSKTWKAKWQDIGLTIDREANAEIALNYPTWERLIPFSSWIKVAQSSNIPMLAIVDNDRLNAFAEQLVAEDKLAASDAAISIKAGEVFIDDAKNGYNFNAHDVKMQIQRQAVVAYAKVTLTPDAVPFKRSLTELQDLKKQAEDILAHRPKLTLNDKTFEPTRDVIGNWISFVENPETKQLTLDFNTEAIKVYLSEIDQQSSIAPGTSTVTLLDGQEVGRSEAASGRSVSTDDAAEQIKVALLGQDQNPTVELNAVEVPPKLQYVKTYSKSSEGLLAVIRDWESQAYGDYGVIIRELGGEHRYAEWQPDKQYVTASTFKMFVAYALLKKINEGSISYDQITDIGWTVDACLTEMIVNSTNPCSVSFLNLMGWAEVQRMVTEAGFTDTLINNGCCEEKHSTVRDETNFMLRLNAGTLLDPAGTERLLSMFKRQVWRGGIPSGVPSNVVVADKVGFYAGYMHDVAIVYAPNGTYILGIMSYGGNNPNMAELSRRVYNFFQN